MRITTTQDKEKARSRLRLIEERIRFLHSTDEKAFPTIVAEHLYEIIKELATATVLLEGFKFVGENAHKELIAHLSNYREIEDYEVSVLDDLRLKRNKSSYEGKQIPQNYLENKKETLLKITEKLKAKLNKGLG